MQPLELIGVERDYSYRWLDKGEGKVDNYPQSIVYRVGGVNQMVRLGFASEHRYGRERKRVIVWIEGHATCFLGADDFESSGDVLFEINTPGQLTMCRYPEPVPEPYQALILVEFKNRISGPGVPNAWAVVANIADHLTMIRTAIARR
jgi:hypothetical protein